MTELERLARLKADIADLRSEADKAQGALDRVLAELKKDFGCSSLKRARRLMARLERKDRVLAKRLDKALERFAREWGHVLEKD